MKRRKYDIRNKRNFVIISILAILVIVIFSLFIYRYKHASRIEYEIPTGSIIHDDSKNYISVEEDAILKVRWNGNYYLIYQDNKINLGKKVIVYNTVTGSLKLYGKFYEIDDKGKIIVNNDETVLSNTTNTKFYKLDDRKYLLVDKQIVSDDRSIEANNYLLVELDKMGNAKLSNNKLNLKTINPATLVTSEYTFDINNEVLKYGSLSVDLKKIIGSTNEYKEKEEDKEKDVDNTQNANNNTTWNSNAGAGNVVNNNDTGNVSDIGEIKDKNKMTAIVRIQEGLSQIDVDYVVYDPYNEYNSVYAEVIKPGKVDVVYLSKTDTHVVFNGLAANTEYKINFVYTTSDSATGKTILNTFESVTLKTKMPTYSILPYRVSNVSNTLSYRVNLQEGYAVTKVNVSLSFKYDEIDPETREVNSRDVKLYSHVDVPSGSKSVIGSFDISEYNIDKGTLMTLNIDSVDVASGNLKINSDYPFVMGR